MLKQFLIRPAVNNPEYGFYYAITIPKKIAEQNLNTRFTIIERGNGDLILQSGTQVKP